MNSIKPFLSLFRVNQAARMQETKADTKASLLLYISLQIEKIFAVLLPECDLG